METKADDRPVPQTRREAEPAKHAKLMVERRNRRKAARNLARKNGHRLGHNNRKCKLCGVTKASGFGGECGKQLPAAS